MGVSQAERRFNPLTGDWVLVSCGRVSRPWAGQIEDVGEQAIEVSYDASCALCPGNIRANGAMNPNYEGIYVFDNDFPAMSTAKAGESRDKCPDIDNGILLRQRQSGQCRVICFSDDHSLTLGRMSTAQINCVVRCLMDQTEGLLADPEINYVQIFENRGAMMGCSNPHPHGQIWAQEDTPTLPARESYRMANYWRSHKRTLLADYLNEETRRRERVVCENEDFVVVVPFWAAWPFETLLVPRRPVGLITELHVDEVNALADILNRIAVRYDNLFRSSFPYSAGIHQRSGNNDAPESFHLHMHFFPPLLRSATIRKFMVGYEMLAEAQRDISPEEAAGRLREQSEVHFLVAL